MSVPSYVIKKIISWAVVIGLLILVFVGFSNSPLFQVTGSLNLKAKSGAPQFLYAGDKAYFRGQVVAEDETRGTALDVEGLINTYKWDFGDGNEGEGSIVSHIFEEPGEYTVKLIVSTKQDGDLISTTPVTVGEPTGMDGPMNFRGAGLFNILEIMNTEVWRQRFSVLERQGYNAVAFIESHPFHHFVKIPGFPEAQNVSDAELKMVQDAFNKFLKIADEHGIEVYIIVYNIFLSPGFARTHGLRESGDLFDDRGVDTALTREYTAAAVKAFHETFPEFGGLIITAGEHPVSAIEFTREGMIEPLLKVDPQPYAIIRDQCVYPDEILYLAEGLENWNTLSKVTEEQWLGNALSLRGELFSRYTGNGTIYLLSGSPCPVFNGGTDAIRELVQEARSRHAEGFIVVPTGTEEANWLFWEAFGYYMNNAHPSRSEEEAYFENIIKERFGQSVPAELFLETANINGDILPMVRRQLFYRNFNYRARYGLPFISFLGMPTYSSFLHSGIDRPEKEEEFTWWIPREERFEEDYLTVQEYIKNTDLSQTESGNMVTPVEIAEALTKMAKDTLARLPALRIAEPDSNGRMWTRNLDEMEFQAYIGQFYASKLLAAVIWEKWVQDKISSQEAREQIDVLLDESISYYTNAMNIYESLYGKGAPHADRLIATQNRQPPWPIDQVFHGQMQRGMGQMLEVFEKEKEMLLSNIDNDRKRIPTWADIS